ncbi:MAG: peroxiredoxin [Nitrospirota bacterium]
MALREGEQAPPFALPGGDGRTVTLDELRRRGWIVLYFYPKDDTPGCTQEACDFRDLNKQFEKAGAVIVGVSPDGGPSHQKFAAKFRLPFPLLSDVDKKVCTAYGVWKQKSMYGRAYMGVERTTVLIAPDGRVAKIYPKVKVTGHADALLAAVKDHRRGA